MKSAAKNLRKFKARVIYKLTRRLGLARMKFQGGFWNGNARRAKVTPQDASELLMRIVANGEPRCAIRYGLFELAAFHQITVNGGLIDGSLGRSLGFNAGVFPTDDKTLCKFAHEYAAASRNADILGLSLFRHGMWTEEEWAFQEFCPNATLIDLHDLDFAHSERPWTRALEDKRVLVVSPFAKSINSQYIKRDKLFPKNNALPEFKSLRTVPAVQSAGGAKCGFADWVDALDSMKKEMAREPFEVALIGAGAYGLPLAAYAKDLGGVGIHMGGITQLLFGIIGARWEKKLDGMINQHWVRPRPDERPPRAINIEGGCYW